MGEVAIPLSCSCSPGVNGLRLLEPENTDPYLECRLCGAQWIVADNTPWKLHDGLVADAYRPDVAAQRYAKHLRDVFAVDLSAAIKKHASS